MLLKLCHVLISKFLTGNKDNCKNIVQNKTKTLVPSQSSLKVPISV